MNGPERECVMCDCPADWVVCFRLDCERAAIINKARQQQIERAHEVIGDPRVSVAPFVVVKAGTNDDVGALFGLVPK
jgi:hypothetical protein